MLIPVIPEGSTYRLFYTGPVGVSGVNVQQFLDLTELPKNVRVDPTFRDNWRVFVRQVSAGISDVSPVIDFFPAFGPPTQMVLTLTALTPLDQIAIEAWYIHSVVR